MKRGDVGGAPPLVSALAYAMEGWRVLPLKCGEKKPLIKGGCNAATTNEAQIREWFTTSPDANVGIATGDASGFFVLDVDPQHGGDDTLRQLLAEHGEFEPTLTQRSGGGGTHYFFKHVPGIRNSASKVGPGLDVRGEGGYIVVAPSVHPSGGRYEFEDPEADIAEAPEWLTKKINETPLRATHTAGPEDIPEGARNTTLTSLAGSMRRRGTSREAIETALLTDNASRCSRPLPESEVMRIVDSIMRYPSGVVAEFTEAGNADRLVARYRHLLRYCPTWKKWLVWDGTRWRPDDRRAIMGYAVETARSIRDEVEG